MTDMVNHPPHYTAHPSGVECIEITQFLGFNLGNAWKYLWRFELKGELKQDLAKALWYLKNERDYRKVFGYSSAKLDGKAWDSMRESLQAWSAHTTDGNIIEDALMSIALSLPSYEVTELQAWIALNEAIDMLEEYLAY